MTVAGSAHPPPRSSPIGPPRSVPRPGRAAASAPCRAAPRRRRSRRGATAGGRPSRRSRAKLLNARGCPIRDLDVAGVRSMICTTKPSDLSLPNRLHVPNLNAHRVVEGSVCFLIILKMVHPALPTCQVFDEHRSARSRPASLRKRWNSLWVQNHSSWLLPTLDENNHPASSRARQ